MTHSFSIGEALRAGWDLTRRHSMLVFQLMLSLVVLQIVSGLANVSLVRGGVGGLLSFIIWICELWLGVGMTLIFLKLAKHEHAQYADVFLNWKVVLRFLVANILAAMAVLLPAGVAGLIAISIGLISGAGIAAGTLGGVQTAAQGAALGAAGGVGLIAAVVLLAAAMFLAGYLALRFAFVRFTILDGHHIIDSLRASARMTRGIKWHLLLFMIVVVILNIIGALLLLVGLLVSVPVTMLAYAHVYLKLKGHHHAA